MWLWQRWRNKTSEKTLRRCIKCVMPDTRPDSVFTKGVCQACLNYGRRGGIVWAKRYKALGKLCDRYRKKRGNDCAVGVSGGKDSYFIVHTLKELGMHPLLITIADPFTKTEAGRHNLENLIKVFKCKHIMYTPDIDSMKETIRKDFEETGEPLKYLEKLIYMKPVEIAWENKLSLVFFGENPMYDYGSTLTENSNSAGYTFMGFYRYWESNKNLEVAKMYGFRDLDGEWDREGCTDNFEQIDSYGYMVHLWLKYPKFGFQRVSDIESRRIREGLQTREKAMELVKEHDPKLDPKALSDFCTTLGYTEKEFWDIVKGSNWNRYL